jgi:oligopeptide/dipeptide ABC transporter ATP-binding protein
LPSKDDATRKLRSGSREPLLRVEQLSVRFAVKRGILRRTVGHVQALDRVDLRVLRGESLVVVGEAGSGKSTLARAIARRAPADGGKVLLDGKDLLTLSKSDLRAVERQVRVLSAETSARAEPLASVLSAVELGAQLLIFDEPFVTLAEAARAKRFAELRSVQEERALTYVLLTRHLRHARGFADEVSVLHAGQIVESGATSTLLTRPLHPYTQALLAADAAATSADPRAAEAEARASSGCRFRARCTYAFSRCAREEPALFVVPGGVSRCFLNDPDGPGN